MIDLKNITGKPVLYRDYDGKVIKGIVTHIGFKNKSLTIIWLHVNFGIKAFLVPYSELIFENIQLTLFN